MQTRDKKRRELRVVLNTNAPFSNSGYGVWCGDFMPRMVKDGWPIAVSSFAGLGGSPIDYQGYKIYPVLADPFGSDALVNHSRHFGARVGMTMQDVWTLQPQALQQLQQMNIAFVPYVPIDQFPVPPQVLDRLRYAYKIITFSKFGHDCLEKSGFASTMIYEGVDTDIFKPMVKEEVRKKFNIPQDKFVFGMIGANKENPPRKAWQEAMEAFKLFSDKHPEAIFFYQSNQNMPGGFPILEFARNLNILDKVFHLDDYLSFIHVGPKEIAEIINTFDVLLQPSATEGFGLLSVEAQACGVPVIVNNYSSMPELVGEGAGLVCKPGKEFFSPAQGYWKFPDVLDLYEKMEEMFVADREKMGEKGRENALKNFDMNKIVKNQWIPLFEKLQDELLPKVVDNNLK
jgi:glycosyltransferase involved in cell wall biosynthesis